MAKIKTGLAGDTVLTPIVRLSYPALFVPKARDDDDGDKKEPSYQVSLLFPKDPAATYQRLGLPPELAAQYADTLKAMKVSIMKLAQEAYGGASGIPAEIAQQDLRKNTGWPFRDQAQKEGEGYEPGALFINCSSKRKPQVVDQGLKRILAMDDPHREMLGKEGKLSLKTPDAVYPGCWVRVSVRPFSFERKGNHGISLGLNNVQLIADDTPLGGGAGAAEDEFAAFGSAGGSASASMADDLADLLAS